MNDNGHELKEFTLRMMLEQVRFLFFLAIALPLKLMSFV